MTYFLLQTYCVTSNYSFLFQKLVFFTEKKTMLKFILLITYFSTRYPFQRIKRSDVTVAKTQVGQRNKIEINQQP